MFKKPLCFVISVSILFALPAYRLNAKAEHREYPYNTDTPWTNDDVQEMVDYACSWVGRIPYKSSVTDNDPDGERFIIVRQNTPASEAEG